MEINNEILRPTQKKFKFKNASIDVKFVCSEEKLSKILQTLDFPNNSEEFLIEELLNKDFFKQKIVENLPYVSSIKTIFPNQIFSKTQHEFLLEILNKMASLQRESVYLMTYIAEDFMTTWRTFYFDCFLNSLLKSHTDLTFLTRFHEYQFTVNELVYMNDLLTTIQSKFTGLKNFAFVNGNLESPSHYPLQLTNARNIMERFGSTLETVTLFFRSRYFHPKEYYPIFETLEDIAKFNVLKSFRIALGGVNEPKIIGIRKIIQSLDSVFGKKEFTSLKDLGIFFANTYLDFDTLLDLVKCLEKTLNRLKSAIFFIQTDFENYSKDQMNELLKIILQNKSLELQEFSLGFCADHGKQIRHTNFDLNVLCELLKKNQWYLMKFDLYYEVNEETTKGDIKNFLIILTKYQENLVKSNITIMRRGVQLLKEFGFTECFDQYFERKRRWLVISKALKRLKKYYRIEILNEILEKNL